MSWYTLFGLLTARGRLLWKRTIVVVGGKSRVGGFGCGRCGVGFEWVGFEGSTPTPSRELISTIVLVFSGSLWNRSVELWVLINATSPLFWGSLWSSLSSCSSAGVTRVLGWWMGWLDSRGVDWLWFSCTCWRPRALLCHKVFGIQLAIDSPTAAALEHHHFCFHFVNYQKGHWHKIVTNNKSSICFCRLEAISDDRSSTHSKWAVISSEMQMPMCAVR